MDRLSVKKFAKNSCDVYVRNLPIDLHGEEPLGRQYAVT